MTQENKQVGRRKQEITQGEVEAEEMKEDGWGKGNKKRVSG